MPTLLFGPGVHPLRVAQGEFSCPECMAPRAYHRTEVRRVLMLFGRDVVTLGKQGEYVECQACMGTFRPEVLAYHGGPSTRRVMAEYKRVMRRLLALMAVADGTIREAEIEAVCDIFQAVCGQRLRREDVMEEVQEVARTPVSVARFLAQVAGHLNAYGKEQVLRAAGLVSRCDGELHEREQNMIRRFGGVLGMPESRVEEILRGA